MSGFGVKSSWWLASAFCLLCGVTCPAAADSPEKSQKPSAKAGPSLSEINKGPFGYWKHLDDDTGKMDSIFKLWRHDKTGTLRGKIVKRFAIKGKQPEKLCTECEGRSKNAPIDGMLFLWGFKYDKGENKWVDGKVLNPQDGKVYHCQITLTKNGTVLEVYGYIKLLVKIGGTSEWTRPTAKELEGIF